jgi:hypothetical protein
MKKKRIEAPEPIIWFAFNDIVFDNYNLSSAKLASMNR